MSIKIIENGVVANAIISTLAEAQDAFPTATCIDSEDGQIGDAWDGEKFVRPEVIDPVPESVTRRQAKVALLQAGLLDEVEAGIEAITDPATKRIAKLDWSEANEFRRDWPLLNQIAEGMGITDGQLDELFRAAAGII